ncbi:RagB/SusD family nutrient uptake outer membrane protein [Fulvivirgaceae bacterium BMA10]|uniref:RagB/SusD family nutrient uptake outer membrane protein n=1 Tax=Splendidivirga corallicola TaxID=3051826 RepID=A0ABT8KS93_9BACT|nr:RagB/SusD family nutrient uptake outer membrane protein [Fulvivirgaceae bacterium BMA10]
MKLRYIITLIVLTTFVLGSCVDDLDVVPIDPDEQTSATLYDDPAAYKQVLAKIYGGLALTGQQGPAGQGDIAGIDEGFSSYLRMYWYHQELTTDEAVIGWNDQTIRDFHDQDWGASDIFIRGMYSRIYYQITLINEFLRETTDGKLNDRGVSQTLKAEIQTFRAEARLLRALSYWHALDLYGNVPFITENDEVGAFLPQQTNRNDLFNYIESELLAVENELAEPRQNEYARADKAAAWMLLAKLYLNAEVYTGQAKYTECVTYCNKVIGAGYALHNDFQGVFLADNHNSSEIIFPIAFDGENTQSWGGITFIIHAAVGGNMSPADFGIDGGWGGIRTTSAFVNKFADPSGNTDSRAMFFTDGQSLEIADISLFTDGYAITKFKNLTAAGVQGSNATFPDTDFPLFRLADAYLMYAEAVIRGGSGGDAATALGYINALRERAYGNTDGNINAGELNLDFILDERSRELYWEGHRRTDLIRFGQFSESTYVWPWKGGVAEGRSTSSNFNLFPIPSADIAANPNLTQNTGY